MKKNIMSIIVFSIFMMLIQLPVEARVFETGSIQLNEFSPIPGDLMRVTLNDKTREVTVTVVFDSEDITRTFTTTADKVVENGDVSFQALYQQNRGRYSEVKLFLHVDDEENLTVNMAGRD